MQTRISKLKEVMQRKGIDCCLIIKPENKLYLSGFTGTDGYVLITHDKNMLFTDFRYIEQAEKQCKGFEIIDINRDALGTIYSKLKSIKTVWFEDNYITYSLYLRINQRFEHIDLIPMGNIIENMRMKKDISEISLIKKSAEIADKTFYYILDMIKPGVKEKDISDEIDYYMKKLGAQQPAFSTIVASGCNSSLPHAQPTDKSLDYGDFVIMDFGCKYLGYCSDMTRTVVIGKPSMEQKHIYQTVLQAQQICLDNIFCGLNGKQADAIARRFIEDNGYRGCFGHGLGHGVGLEIHEMPSLSPTIDVLLEENMVVTIEPGIYIKGKYGVRIEDLILLTDQGIKNLTCSEKQLIVL